MQDEYLGFFMKQRPTGSPGKVQEDAALDGCSAGISENQQPEEAPVDAKEGEPLPEVCVVEFTDDEEAVTVDGVVMNMSYTLKVLPCRLHCTGCFRSWWKGQMR